MTLDIRGEIRHILATTSISDPSEITERVISSIPKELLPAALRIALRSMVIEVIQRERYAHIDHADPAADQTCTDTQRPNVGGAIRPNRSWKRDMIRAGIFRERVKVGRARESWKLLGECTAADCLVIADTHTALAGRIQAKAECYRKLAEVLNGTGKSTVAELPADFVEKIMQGGDTE